jgi:hypothetical protein
LSNRLPPLATVPSYSVSAFDMTRSGSTCVSGTPSAKSWIAACMTFAAVPQSVQQLWNSSRRRTTSRDRAGVSRSIFARTAA